MLILTRNQGESLHIGEAVVVTVLGVKGGQVRLGVTAPKAVKVLRSELLDRDDDSDRGSGRSASYT